MACVSPAPDLFQLADGRRLVVYDLGFDPEAVAVLLAVLPLRLQLRGQHLHPGLQAPAVLSQRRPYGQEVVTWRALSAELSPELCVSVCECECECLK